MQIETKKLDTILFVLAIISISLWCWFHFQPPNSFSETEIQSIIKIKNQYYLLVSVEMRFEISKQTAQSIYENNSIIKPAYCLSELKPQPDFIISQEESR